MTLLALLPVALLAVVITVMGAYKRAKGNEPDFEESADALYKSLEIHLHE